METQAPSSSVPPSLNPEPKKSWLSSHMILGLVFLVVVLGAIVSGIYYWQTVSQIPPVAQFPVHKDEMAGWKTYTNTEYGFEVKYPTTGSATYSVGESQIKPYISPVSIPGVTILVNCQQVSDSSGKPLSDSITITIYTIAQLNKIYELNATDLADFLSKAKPQHIADVGDFKPIQFNDVPAFDVLITGMMSGQQIFVEHNKVIYDLSGIDPHYSEKFTSAEKQILSTFKFTK